MPHLLALSLIRRLLHFTILLLLLVVRVYFSDSSLGVRDGLSETCLDQVLLHLANGPVPLIHIQLLVRIDADLLQEPTDPQLVHAFDPHRHFLHCYLPCVLLIHIRLIEHAQSAKVNRVAMAGLGGVLGPTVVEGGQAGDRLLLIGAASVGLVELAEFRLNGFQIDLGIHFEIPTEILKFFFFKLDLLLRVILLVLSFLQRKRYLDELIDVVIVHGLSPEELNARYPLMSVHLGQTPELNSPGVFVLHALFCVGND